MTRQRDRVRRINAKRPTPEPAVELRLDRATTEDAVVRWLHWLIERPEA